MPRDRSFRRPVEGDWLGGEPGAMLRCLADLVAADPPAPALGPRSVERKVRLFYCACARLLGAPARDAAVVEAHADRAIPARRVRPVREEAGRVSVAQFGDDAATMIARTAAGLLVVGADAHRALRLGWLRTAWPVDPAVQAALLRDLIDHPFRPAAFDPSWRTADTVGLARAVYEDRAFERMPLLADALMDAGCADEQVLGHCRSAGPHVRGCWVVDRVFGRG
jgi:hypothetical protein